MRDYVLNEREGRIYLMHDWRVWVERTRGIAMHKVRSENA